ncbi:diacylglycerol/lipid kinase family protein [Natronospira proteinivora]
MNRVELIVNPAAGQGRAGEMAEALEKHLRELGASLVTHLTMGPGQGVALARELAESGARTLAVAGGDGTLFEIINGCLQSDGPVPDLALIPLGSGNDFAKSLGIPMEWEDACDRLVLGTKRRVDVGQCNDLFFINSLGIGLDAQIAKASQSSSWIPRQSRYMSALLRSLIGKRATPIKLSHDQGELEQSVTLVVVANGSYEGGHFQLAPHADIEDGRLDLVIAPDMSRRAIMRYLPLALDGEVEGIPGYQRWLTRRVRIQLPEPTLVHADGEIIYHRAKRLEIGILPGALCFLC